MELVEECKQPPFSKNNFTSYYSTKDAANPDSKQTQINALSKILNAELIRFTLHFTRQKLYSSAIPPPFHCTIVISYFFKIHFVRGNVRLPAFPPRKERKEKEGREGGRQSGRGAAVVYLFIFRSIAFLAVINHHAPSVENFRFPVSGFDAFQEF